MSETSGKKRSIYCPDCGSSRVRRSRTRGTGERLLHLLLFVSPCRCQECYKRFFRCRLVFNMKGPRHHVAAGEGSAHR